jgi:hypothetical protein
MDDDRATVAQLRVRVERDAALQEVVAAREAVAREQERAKAAERKLKETTSKLELAESIAAPAAAAAAVGFRDPEHLPDDIIDSNWDDVVDNFDDMGLREELVRGINTSGFENPTAVQQQAIVPIIKGHDVIVQSPWILSGRTAAVCIGALQKIDTGLRQCQVLVLTPTRELAQNVQKVRLLLCPPCSVPCCIVIMPPPCTFVVLIVAW